NRFDEIIRRAQPRIGPLPSFRNFQKFEIAAASLALEGDLESVRRVFEAEARAFPGESPVGAVRSCGGVGLLRQKGVSRKIGVQRLSKKLLGAGQRFCLLQTGAWRRLLENMFITDNATLGIDAHANLFFLSRAEEAHCPIPDADL